MQVNDGTKKIQALKTANLALVSAVSLVEGVYFLIFLGFVLHFFPIPSPLEGKILTEWVWHLKPERDIFLYRVSVVYVVLLQAGLLYILRKKLESESLRQSLAKFLVIKSACLAVILFALFKIAVYGSLPFFNYVIYAAFAAAVAVKVSWFKLNGWLPRISAALERKRAQSILNGTVDVLALAAVITFLFVPDRHSVFARLFTGDLLYHYDGILMSAAWAFWKGCLFYVDVISQYGMGMSTLPALITRAFGGLSYENMISALMVLCLLYLALCYFFMRAWLKSAAISFIGLFLIIKFQMFHYGVSDPYIWKHPSSSALRFIYDVPFFFFVLLHVRTSLKRYLVAAGLLCGLALYHTADTGAYLLLTLYAYLAGALIVPEFRPLLFRSKKDVPAVAGYFALPVLLMLALFWVRVGAHVLTKDFWANYTEFFQFFTNGFFALPMYTLVEEKNVGGFVAGWVVPLAYLFNLTLTASGMFFKKAERENIFPVLLSVYGLCMYHYYVCRSSHTYFYAVIVPMVFIACFWMSRLTGLMAPAKRQAVLVLGGFFSVFSLFMTQSFIEYPNVLALKKISFEKDREVLAREYDFDKDAKLIAGLTAPDEKAALISSFETAILMAADRKPFFYFFPLVNSRYRNMKDFGGTYLFSQERLQRTLDQLEREKPRHIFIEKKLLEGGIMTLYYKRYTSLAVFVAYLQEKYIPAEQGEYLVALRRKE